MTSLADARSAGDLIALDPEPARTAAQQLCNLRDAVDRCRRALVDLERVDDWEGEASRSFEHLMHQFPDRSGRAIDALAEAAHVLDTLADEIEAARTQADRAIDRWREASAATAQWRNFPMPPPISNPLARFGPDLRDRTPTDPGGPMRRDAEHLLATARNDLDDAIRAATAALGLLGHAAPSWEFGQRGIPNYIASAAGGAWGGAMGVQTLYETFGYTRLGMDPGGWLADVADTGAGAAHVARNPDEWDEFAALVFDLDILRDDPARWIGRFAFDVLLTLPVRGGSVASRVGNRATTFARRTITDRGAVSATALAARFPRAARLSERAAAHFADAKRLDQAFAKLGFPSLHGAMTLDGKAVARTLLLSAGDVDRGRRGDDDLDELAREHGHDPADYRLMEGEVEIDGKTVKIEFVEHQVASEPEDRVLAPRIVHGSR